MHRAGRPIVVDPRRRSGPDDEDAPGGRIGRASSALARRERGATRSAFHRDRRMDPRIRLRDPPRCGGGSLGSGAADGCFCRLVARDPSRRTAHRRRSWPRVRCGSVVLRRDLPARSPARPSARRPCGGRPRGVLCEGPARKRPARWDAVRPIHRRPPPRRSAGERARAATRVRPRPSDELPHRRTSTNARPSRRPLRRRLALGLLGARADSVARASRRDRAIDHGSPALGARGRADLDRLAVTGSFPGRMTTDLK